MPDIFDEIAPDKASGGDIFDEIAPDKSFNETFTEDISSGDPRRIGSAQLHLANKATSMLNMGLGFADKLQSDEDQFIANSPSLHPTPIFKPSTTGIDAAMKVTLPDPVERAARYDAAQAEKWNQHFAEGIEANPLTKVAKVVGPPLHGGIEISRRAAQDWADGTAALLRGEKLPGLRNIKAFANDPLAPSPADEESQHLSGGMRALEAAGQMGATLPTFIGESVFAPLPLIMGTNQRGEVDPVGMVAGLTIGRVHEGAANFIKSKFFADTVSKLAPDEMRAMYQRFAAGQATEADQALMLKINGLKGKEQSLRDLQRMGGTITEPWAKTPSQAQFAKVAEQLGGIAAANGYFLTLQMPQILSADDPKQALLESVAQLGAASVPGLVGLAGKPGASGRGKLDITGKPPVAPEAGLPPRGSSQDAPPASSLKEPLRLPAPKDIFDEITSEPLSQSQAPRSPDVRETTGLKQTSGAVSATSPASDASASGKPTVVSGALESIKQGIAQTQQRNEARDASKPYTAEQALSDLGSVIEDIKAKLVANQIAPSTPTTSKEVGKLGESRVKTEGKPGENENPIIPLPAGKRPLTDADLVENSFNDLTAEGVTGANAYALITGKKTPQQVVDEQLGITRQGGSIDAKTMVIEENDDGSRTAMFTPDAGPSSSGGFNIGQMSHEEAIRIAREQGINRITRILRQREKSSPSQGTGTTPGQAKLVTTSPVGEKTAPVSPVKTDIFDKIAPEPNQSQMDYGSGGTMPRTASVGGASNETVKYPQYVYRARMLMERKFAGMKRQAGDAAREHINRVADMTDDPIVKAVAYLHDIVEDTPTTIEEIRRDFGDTIAEAVDAETWRRTDGETYEHYIERLMKNDVAAKSKLKDLADNIEFVGKFNTEKSRAKVKLWTETAERLQRKLAGLPDITHTINKKWMPDGVTERNIWEQRQIHSVVNTALFPPTGKKPVIAFTGGGAAAGKSTIIGMMHESKALHDDVQLIISADDYKTGEGSVADAKAEGIPEFQALKNERPDAAYIVHKESTKMAKATLARVVNEGRSAAYDATMSDSATDWVLAKAALDAGHDVELIGVYLEQDEAVKRADARAKKTGRHVHEKFVREGHAGFAKSFPTYLENFPRVFLWDNNRYKDPRLIVRKDENGIEILDPEAYIRFAGKEAYETAKQLQKSQQKRVGVPSSSESSNPSQRQPDDGQGGRPRVQESEANADTLAGGLTDDASTTTRQDGNGRDGGNVSGAVDSTRGEQSTGDSPGSEGAEVQTSIRSADGRKAKSRRSVGDGKPVADVNGTPDTAEPATTDTGTKPEGGTGIRSVRGTESIEQLPGGVQRSNLRLTENPAPTGAVSRIKANIAALTTLRAVEKESRTPTPEEVATMAQWSGWGSFKELFNSGKAERREWDQGWQKKYGKAYDQLRELMTESEFNAAAESSVNAHYTSKQVVDFAWKVAERLGFKGGKALEPSAGSGVFLGYAPDSIASGTQWTTVELDAITGRLLAQLYPQADTRIQGFEETKLPNGYFDMAISNVPFHEVGPGKEYPDLNLHNYFIARMLDKVRPGGLVIAITTKNTMEARPRQREFIAGKGQLVAAIRLPNDAFKESAATEVVTDLLILRRPDGKPFEGQRWLNQTNVAEEDAEPMLVNEYFAAHPDMVLGKHAHEGSMYRKNEYTVVSTGNLQAKLDKALEALPKDIIAADEAAPEVTTTQRDDYSLYLNKDGQVVESRNFTEHLPSWDSTKPALVATAKSYIAVRDVLKNQYRLERMEGTTEAEIEARRKQLAKHYKALVKQLGGTITDSTRKLKHLETDPDYYTVLGLEYTTVEKHPTDPTKTVDKVHEADVLSKRVGKPDSAPESAENAQSALAISQAYKGGMDMEFIRQLTGMDDGAIAKELVEQDLAYLDVDTGKLVTRNEYLSGDIRDKYAKAIFAAKEDPQYLRNVEALKKVIPPTDPFGKLKFGIEGRWIPTTIHNQFAKDEMGLNGDEVRFVATTEEFAVAGTGRGGRYGLSERARVEYSTSERSAMELLDSALNMKRVRVMKTDSDGKSYEDTAASTNANQIVDKIKAEFDKWTHTTEARVPYRSFDSDRGEYREENLPVWDVMEREWNRKKNSFVARTADGSRLKLPGVSDWFWRKQHILDGTQWAIQEGSGVFAYGVGSGKTALIAIINRELKRIKLARKPLIVAKKPTIGQYRSTIEQLYPGSKVLIPSENDFKKENRRKLLSRIASGNFDFIIVTHEQFKSVRPSEAAIKAFFDEQIDSLRQVLVEMGAAQAEFDKSTRGMAREVANIVKKIKTLKKQLDKNLTQLGKHHDIGLAWEDMGIDALMIDESHNFKNIPITTQLDNVKGVPSSFSQRAIDLMVKARNVQQRTNGRNVFFFTGTPVSNTLAELWGQIHVTNPKILEDMGVKTFDSFVTAFAEVTSNFEFGWDNKFKEVTRMSKFKNGAALTTLTRMGMSVKIGNEELGLDVPKMKGGSPQLKVTPVNPEFQRWLDLVEDISSKWDGLDKKSRFENSWVPIATMRAGAAAALDPRCIFPDAKDHPDSKLNTAIRDIFDEWQRGKSKRTTMMVFADMYRTLNTDKLMGFVGGSTKAKDNAVVVDLESDPTESDDDSTDTGAKDEAAMEANAVGEFNIYNDIRAKLVAMGVPEHEIGVITEHGSDTKRDALFDKVRAGAVRILIGSTEKIGEGVDVPQRMSAEFHLDPPMQMTAAKMDQRIGRIIRQGNLHSPKNWNTEVNVTLYGQERSMDAPIYNMLATKGKMTLQALKGQFLGDEFEDPASELTVAMASLVAQATGDTRALDVAKLTEDVRKLTMEENAFYRQVSDVKRERDTAESAKVSAETLATDMEELSKAAAEATKDKDSLVMTGAKKSYTGEDIQPTLDKIATNMEASLSKKDDRIHLVLRFGDNLYAGITGRATDEWYLDGDGKRGVRLGRSYSVEFTVADAPPSMGNFGIETKKRILSSELSSPKNLLRAVNAVAGRAETRAKEATATAAKATKDQAAWQKKLEATTFAKADELKAKRVELADLQQDLMGKKKPTPEFDYGEGGEMPRESSFMDWLNEWIKKTDFDPTKVMEGITGAPAWLTRGALNAALRAIRLAIKAGKSMATAIREGIEAMRAENVKGFNEQEAATFLESEALKNIPAEEPLTGWREIKARLVQAENRLDAAVKLAGNKNRAESDGVSRQVAMNEKNLATAKYREIQAELRSNPEYVEYLMTRTKEIQQALNHLRKESPRNERWMADLEGEFETLNYELSEVPKKLVSKIYNDKFMSGDEKTEREKRAGSQTPGTDNPLNKPEGGEIAPESKSERIKAAVVNFPATLRGAKNAAVKTTQRLSAMWSARENRDMIAATYDAAENGGELFGRQAANEVLHTLNRSFGAPADRVGARNPVREQALSFVIEANISEAELRDFKMQIESSDFAASKSGKEALKAIEFAENHWERLEPVAQLYKQITDAQVDHENLAGVETLQIKGGYVMHMTDTMANHALPDVGSAGGNISSPFLKTRVHSTFADAISAGEVPKSINAVDLLQRRLALGQKLINHGAWVDGMFRFLDPKTQQPIVTHTITKVRKDGKEYEDAPHGFVKMQLGAQTFSVMRGYDGLIKSIITPSTIRNSMAGNLAMELAGGIKHSMLVFDSYHLGRLAFWSSMVRGSVLPGDPTSYRRGLTLLDNTIPEIQRMAEGGEIPKAWLKDLIESKRQLALLVSKGLNVGSVGDNIATHFVQNLPIAGTFNKFLFQKYQRGATAEASLIELRRQINMNPGVSEDVLARRVASDLNKRFGNLQNQSFIKNKNIADIARIIFLAPQWNESLIRSEIGAAKEIGKAPFDSWRTKRVNIGLLGRAVATALIGTFLANQIINMITRGKPTWENEEEDNAAKLSAYIPDVVGDGPGFMLNPLTLPAEMSELLMKKTERTGDMTQAAKQVFASRLGPLGRVPYTLAVREDAMGAKLRTGGEVFGQMASSLVPLPIIGGTIYGAGKQMVTGEKEEKYPGQFQRQAFQTFGVKLDAAPSPDQRIRNLAKEFNREKGITPAAEFFHGDYYDLDRAAIIGNKREMAKAMEIVLEKKTKDDIKKHYNRWATAPFTGKAEREQEFITTLNPEQRATLEAARAKRKALKDEILKQLP